MELKNDVIRIENVVKIYDPDGSGEARVEALKGINLMVKQGEFVAIMGASGSGKSTLMNILGCLDLASVGNYYLDGIPVNSLTKDELSSIRNQKIGFVFQGFNLLPRTTALENVELPLLYNRNINNRIDSHKLAMEALTKVGLQNRMYHHPSQLSGGQQQRVAIARALVNKPNLILAEEPTGNLDTKTSAEIMTLFQELNDQDITIVLVTHEHDIAEFSKRIVEFRDGNIIKDIGVEQKRILLEVRD
jgi:putative ABC transport system ATP-binding protein